MFRTVLIGAWLVLAAPAIANAESSSLTPEQQQELDRFRDIYRSEHPKTGDVPLAAANATLHLGDRYYFLDAADAKRVLIEAWGNPPGSADGVLGVVFPKDKTFLDSWGAVVTYDSVGYVSDKDAKSANYDKVLQQSRDDEDKGNQERAKSSAPPIHLVGWAQAPTYDPASHSEVWARDLKFGDQKVDTLNYDTRILGRRGVLSLNLVSTMDELALARAAANDLAHSASFDPGSRYADFSEGQDKKAAFGVAGLVAAGLGVAAAQKFGMLAILLLAAKKGAVVLVAAFAWLSTRFRKFFGLQGKTKSAATSLQIGAQTEAVPTQSVDEKV